MYILIQHAIYFLFICLFMYFKNLSYWRVAHHRRSHELTLNVMFIFSQATKNTFLYAIFKNIYRLNVGFIYIQYAVFLCLIRTTEQLHVPSSCFLKTLIKRERERKRVRQRGIYMQGYLATILKYNSIAKQCVIENSEKKPSCSHRFIVFNVYNRSPYSIACCFFFTHVFREIFLVILKSLGPINRKSHGQVKTMGFSCLNI